MNLHIMQEEKFTEGFVSFIFENFPADDHHFFLTGKKKEHPALKPYLDHITWVKDYREMYQNKAYKRQIQAADRLIINGVMGNELLVPHLGIGMLKKTYFFFWGGDIYSLGYPLPAGRLRPWIKQQMKKYMFTRAKGLITLIPGDYDVLCKYVKPRGTHFVARMESGGVRPVDLIEKYRTAEKAKHPYKVIVGNSATATNQHMQVIDFLSQYRTEDVQFLVPLSYGNEDYEVYAEKVIAYGKEKLGDAFVPLTGFMDKEQYYKMLNDCSVGIFNHNRQQALGNIYALLTAGAKVYIRSDTVMWEQMKRDHLILHDVEEIQKESFDQFIRREQEEICRNHQAMADYHKISNAVKEWSVIFSS